MARVEYVRLIYNDIYTMFARNIGAAAPSSTDFGKTPFQLISLSGRQTKPLFSNNAQVYYTPHSLGTMPGTVSNRRHIANRT